MASGSATGCMWSFLGTNVGLSGSLCYSYFFCFVSFCLNTKTEIGCSNRCFQVNACPPHNFQVRRGSSGNAHWGVLKVGT